MNYIKKFSDIRLSDISLVGGKNASLGEMYQSLKPRGINLPEGFVVTADAFSKLLEDRFFADGIYQKLENLDPNKVSDLQRVGKEIREEIILRGLPHEIGTSIRNAYSELCHFLGENLVDVAVRSSATAEDLPEASFAGQQETFLNVRGEEALIEASLRCFSSLFTDRAISYRAAKGFDHRQVRLSVGIQKMVRSDMASSGVIFTLDTETGANNVIVVTSSWGLGEYVVGGRVDPDEFLVSKPLLNSAPCPILRKKLGSKKNRLIYSKKSTHPTEDEEVLETDQKRFSLSDEEILELSRWAREIEEFYSAYHKKYTPMDIEWAKDGPSGELYILQARPETVHKSEVTTSFEEMKLKQRSKILLRGSAVGHKIGSGKVKIVQDIEDLKNFSQGDILVTEMTDPDWEPVMKKASAIVTDKGGRTCHAAIVSREHGVPCIVGTGNATLTLKDRQLVTVVCSEGDEGMVMEGELEFETQKISWVDLPKTKTQIMVNVGNPAEALKFSQLPVDGVGLARMEFIIAEHVKIHPMALLHPEKIIDQKTQEVLRKITWNYCNSPEKFFIDKLAEGVSVIAGAFFPRPVIVRMSDFKTNEYSHLIGGEAFEPKEENPMIGFRGAVRYYSEAYKEGFRLECESIRKVREYMGLRNVKIMIPFCRTAKEGELVIQELEKNGLIQGKNDLEVYVMCELPSNVLELKSFANIFDGFSIGSNDLTQMTLGVDRDSELIKHLFDERDPASLKMLELAIKEALTCRRPIGICGQAPSDYPEMAAFLVKQGINSISLSPDSVFKVKKIVSGVEGELSAEMRPEC